MPIYHQNPQNDSGDFVERSAYQSLGHELLSISPVTVYCGLPVLEDDLRRLAAERWVAARVDATRWANDGTSFDDVLRVLPLPSYWANSEHLRQPAKLRDALDELLVPDSGGLALVVTDFDDFALSGSRKVRSEARYLLGLLVEGARRLQLFGKSLLVMAQTKDPDLHLEDLGGVPAWWNAREFVRANRGNVRL